MRRIERIGLFLLLVFFFWVIAGMQLGFAGKEPLEGIGKLLFLSDKPEGELSASRFFFSFVLDFSVISVLLAGISQRVKQLPFLMTRTGRAGSLRIHARALWGGALVIAASLLGGFLAGRISQTGADDFLLLGFFALSSFLTCVLWLELLFSLFLLLGEEKKVFFLSVVAYLLIKLGSHFFLTCGLFVPGSVLWMRRKGLLLVLKFLLTLGGGALAYRCVTRCDCLLKTSKSL